ncbi:MAG: phage integrase N-terminal domain-containing protein [Acidiferrobacterales bacterium]|nr:phage integrase N-terminal domain-containing protein [Acidiferrobacterales bacterium]
MRRLNRQLKDLCKNNRDGSYGTQAQRERVLTLIANQLRRLGFRQLHAKSLRPKHVEALVRHWLETNVATGTMKNRMAALRWWAAKVNRKNVVARSNDHYGLPRRQYVNGANRAIDLDKDKLSKITDPNVRLSLELQQAFGLRREEAIKLRPALADKSNTLWLKPSWTKGGRAREVPIRTEAQRAVLSRAHHLAGKGSLIPAAKTYVQQLKLYEGQCIRAGLCKMHGLRYAYAQRRFLELTGFQAPIAGGPKRSSLSADERALDQKARAVISAELGHNREQITVVYLGR